MYAFVVAVGLACVVAAAALAGGRRLGAPSADYGAQLWAAATARVALVGWRLRAESGSGSKDGRPKKLCIRNIQLVVLLCTPQPVQLLHRRRQHPRHLAPVLVHLVVASMQVTQHQVLDQAVGVLSPGLVADL